MKGMWSIAIVLLFWGAGCSTISGNDTDCVAGMRCSGDVLQRCEAFEWADIVDCSLEGALCLGAGDDVACRSTSLRATMTDRSGGATESREDNRRPLDTQTAESTDPDSPYATDTDGETETETETETPGAELVFSEDFNGISTFSAIRYPNGDPHDCEFQDGVAFSNDGQREILITRCYDEAFLEIDLNLPEETYLIAVSWATGRDPHSFTLCDRSSFHAFFGASCATPNRIVLVNDTLIKETPGRLTDFAETTEIVYTGAIETFALGMASAGKNDPFTTLYDFVKIYKLNDEATDR